MGAAVATACTLSGYVFKFPSSRFFFFFKLIELQDLISQKQYKELLQLQFDLTCQSETG